MTERRQKRYPADRLKLHDLLGKRERQLQNLQAEVKELRQIVKQADATAINATAELYHITPEQLSEIMKKMYGDRSKPIPEIQPKRKNDEETSEYLADKEDSFDKEDA